MRRPWMLAAALLLTSCSGGGGAAAPPVAGHASAAPIAPALVTTSFVFGQLPATASAVRRPNYVTASVASVQIVLNTVNGGAPPAGLTASVTSNLTLTTCPCTVTGPAVPPGNDTFTLTAYDAQNGTGNVISKATPTLTIVAGQTNSNTIALNGVPASFTIAPPAAAFGTAFAATAFSVTVKDADGHTIMGAYQNPVTLTDADTSGATTLATSGSDSPAAGQLLSSSDTATLAYTGGALAPVSISASASGATTASSNFAPTGVAVVTLSTDTSLGVTPGSCPAGTTGDLRAAICNAAAGSAIVFNTTTMCAGSLPCKITLGAALPQIAENLTIDGGAFGRVVIDGASAYRVFWVDTGTVALRNLQIQNALAQGATGGSGGAAGLGAGLFVNQASAVVSVTNVYFLDDIVVGGAGGTGGAGSGTGVAGATGSTGATGSSVVTGQGGTGGSGGTGGVGGFFGGGGAGGIGGPGGFGPLAFGGGGAGGAGGAGGFGGGGGAGGAGGVSASSPGGGGYGGSGGPGGGGGGGGGTASIIFFGPGGSGGLLATLSGGNGSNGASSVGSGGGGAAAGPAIFVNAGSVTTVNSGASGSSATGGAGGGGGATAGTADPTPVFNYAGTVNGLVTTGPVAAALSSVIP